MEFINIYKFIAEELDIDMGKLNPESDIYDKFDLEGDDCFEFEEVFSRKFNVDMSKFLWYFHHAEEGHNIGGLFIKPPYARVKRIAITPTILLDSVNSGFWSISYPQHTLPKKRYDIILSQWIWGILILLFILIWILGKA